MCPKAPGWVGLALPARPLARGQVPVTVTLVGSLCSCVAAGSRRTTDDLIRHRRGRQAGSVDIRGARLALARETSDHTPPQRRSRCTGDRDNENVGDAKCLLTEGGSVRTV